MKKIILIVLAISIAFSLFAKKSIKGYSNTFLENYEINKIAENTFELNYSNSNEKFIIEVCPEEEQCCYLLRNNKVEVMYLCNYMGFGLRKTPCKSQKLNTSQYCHLLNNKAFKNQSLLTPKKKRTKDALALIACFFPEVVNLDSRTLVFNTIKQKNVDLLTAKN